MNTRGMLLVAVICLFLTPVIGRAQNNKSSKAKIDDGEAARLEVLRLEEFGRTKVVSGDNNWDELIEDGAYMIGPDGNVMTFVKGKGFPPYPVANFTLSEMIARPFGEVVVVTGLAKLSAFTPDRKTVKFKMRFMNVWKKFPSGWRMVVTERTGVTDTVKGPSNGNSN